MKVVSWMSLQIHNVQQAKEATDPQIYTATHTYKLPRLDRILESRDFKKNCNQL